MIKRMGKAVELFGENLLNKSATMFKGARYTSADMNKAGRIGGTITSKGRMYRGAGRAAIAVGKHPYMAAGVVGSSAAVAGLKGRSSGVNGLSGQSSGSIGLQ